MADLMVRRPNGGQVQPLTSRELDPFRIMREMLRWDPFQELLPSWPAEPRLQAFAPAFEVKETKGSYLFKADMPGVKESDIEVTMTGNMLTIAGKREEEKEDKNDRYYSCERSYGSFRRSFTLPEGADAEHLHAELSAGVLTIAVPKKPEVQPKKIQVKATEKSVKS
jgi:HSP20 family protein